MDRGKKTKIELWILGLLLGVPLVTGIIVATVQWIFSSENPSEITSRAFVVLGAISLSFLLGVLIWRWEKADKRDLNKKIQAELGLKPICKKDLYDKYVNNERFYAPMESPPLYPVAKHIFHGEYNGYEICILDPCEAPIRRWTGGQCPQLMAVHIRSRSFNFPKFLIRNNLNVKFFVKGNQKAQMQFARPHILKFFNQTQRFAAQGNGNEFIFHEIDGEPKNYKLLIEHAFIVLKLLTNAAPFSSVSEIGQLHEKHKNTYKWKLLELACFLIFMVIWTWFSYS